MNTAKYIAYENLNNGERFFNPAPSVYSDTQDPAVGHINKFNVKVISMGSLEKVTEICGIKKTLFTD